MCPPKVFTTPLCRKSLLSAQDARLALNDAVRTVDEQFLSIAQSSNLTAGSTAVLALLLRNQLLIVNLGDSRAILCQREPQQAEPCYGPVRAVQLTRDHSPDREDERRRIQEHGGRLDKWSGGNHLDHTVFGDGRLLSRRFPSI